MRDYSIFDELDEGVQIIDPEMKYVFLNTTLLRELNMERHDLFGKPMIEKFPGIDETKIYKKIIDCLERKQVNSYVNEFDLNGVKTFYELKIQAIQEGVIIFSRDITKTKKGEIILKETNKELEYFAHIAAHDMREPVRRISILSEELLLDHHKHLTFATRELCEQLNDQAQSLMTLISDFRALSNIGGRTLEKADCWIVKKAKDIVLQFDSDFKNKDITLNWPQDDFKIQAYPTLMAILFRNIYENALKYACRRIDFELKEDRQNNEITVSISNFTNEPVPETNLFLPHVTGNADQNTGLGLTICKKIISKHSGRIWSDYLAGKFSIHFALEIIDTSSTH